MKNQKKIFKYKKGLFKKTKGFSLVETMVAIFIFTLAMAMLSGSFGNFLKNYATAKKTERNIQNAQYAMNLMAKTLRTSAVVTTNNFPLNTFDYSQGKCIRYSLLAGTNGKIQMSTTTDAAPAQLSDCNFNSLSTTSDLTTNDIKTAAVSATASNGTNYGLVTISLKVLEPGQAGAGVPIQTSVSLRQNN